MSINYKVDGSVVLITIDRPKKMNALDSDLQRKLGRAISDFEADETL